MGGELQALQFTSAKRQPTDCTRNVFAKDLTSKKNRENIVRALDIAERACDRSAPPRVKDRDVRIKTYAGTMVVNSGSNDAPVSAAAIRGRRSCGTQADRLRPTLLM